MKQNEANRLRLDILKALNVFIENEFAGNQSKAAEFLGENRQNFYKYLSGERSGIDKLLDLLIKTQKYQFTYKIKKC